VAKKKAVVEPVMSEQTEQRIEAFAEDLGKLLGHAQNKAQNWLGQRKQIVDHLEGIRDTANTLLTQLGHQARKAVTSGTRGYRSAGASATLQAVEKKTRKLSAAARKAISDAQKKRWAKYRKATATTN
jgi:hypothetical protein